MNKHRLQVAVDRCKVRRIPYPMRALPPGTNTKPYTVYRVLKPIEVTTGRIAPAFGEIGLGVQHELPTSVARLLRHKFLEEVTS